jgi:hypothetical protein
MNRKAMLGLLCLSVAAVQLFAADGAPAGPEASGSGASGGTGNTNTAVISSRDIDTLRKQIAEQEKEIEKLQKAVSAQREMLETTMRAVSSRGVSTTAGAPMLVNASGAGVLQPVMPSARAAQDAASGENPAPLSLKIGNTYLTPVGFLDATYVNRSTNVGSGIGTNFGSIPFNNPASGPGNLNDSLLSVQNSRIGARFDGIFHDTKILGYWESDFLGFVPTNVAVSSNSDSFRLRLFFVDLTKGQWEFTGGQTWSLMTPGRTGISPLPSNIFFTNNIDTNYQIGLAWARQTGFRVTWHPSDHVAWAFAAENPDQYIGGSAGGGVAVLPSNLPPAMATQVNNGANNLATPGLIPDLITKVAWDPNSSVHIEGAGILTTTKTYNPATFQSYTTEGGGFEANSNFQIFKNLRVIENFTYGKGIGRYFFGQGPDVILYDNGAPANVKSGGTVDGLEFQASKNTTLYAYYGGAYYGRLTTIDPLTHRPVGYGGAFSAPGNNRTIQEFTFGVQQTLWKDPRWGALRFDAQYSYLFRDPWWFVTAAAPRQADTNMLFLNLRYTLPGAPPKLK